MEGQQEHQNKDNSPHQALTHTDPRTGEPVTKEEFQKRMEEYREDTNK